MKSGKIGTLFIVAALLTGCSQGDSSRNESADGTPIDSTVIGRDTTSVDTRRDIEQSDQQKLTNPGRDTTNSDERKR